MTTYVLQAGPLLSSFDYKTGQHSADARTEELVRVCCGLMCLYMSRGRAHWT